MPVIMNGDGYRSSWRRYISEYEWIIVLVSASVLIYGAHPIMLNMCKNEQGKIVFNSAAVVLLTELTKLLISLALWIRDLSSGRDGGKSARMLPLASCWKFAIPAVLYCFNNNLEIIIQEHLDPASFRILSNLKIVFTAALYRMFLKNRLSFTQWVAIVLLVAGSVSSGFTNITPSTSSTSPKKTHVEITGLLLVLIYCFISSLSGIYTERILKKNKQVSIHQQSLCLYLFGFIFNSVGYIMSSDDSVEGFFTGFSALTVVIIVTQSLHGIIQADFLKNGNSIMRVFISTSAMPVTAVLSFIFFSTQLNVFFCMALVSVMLAIWLYYKK